MSYLHKTNVNFKFQLPPHVRIFGFFKKSGLIKTCSSSEDQSIYKTAWSHVDWCKFCIHLRSLNVHHIEIVKYRELKIMEPRSPSMA
jgi:hypothetical protein